MKLSEVALERIKKKQTRLKLCLALNCIDRTMWNYINSNSDNLTKAAALQVIREETGLTDEEILVSEETESQK